MNCVLLFCVCVFCLHCLHCMRLIACYMYKWKYIQDVYLLVWVCMDVYIKPDVCVHNEWVAIVVMYLNCFGHWSAIHYKGNNLLYKLQIFWKYHAIIWWMMHSKIKKWSSKKLQRICYFKLRPPTSIFCFFWVELVQLARVEDQVLGYVAQLPFVIHWIGDNIKLKKSQI